jgi:hypothetical protein
MTDMRPGNENGRFSGWIIIIERDNGQGVVQDALTGQSLATRGCHELWL